MGRPIRRFNPGTLLHICNRGSRQEEIFSDPYDFNHCENILHHAISQHSVSLLCYCLMPNHWHLLVLIKETPDLSKMMKMFTSNQARYWRWRHDTIGNGAVYQNRYRAHEVARGRGFLKVAHYIERNAFTAGLCPSPSHWPWGSAHPQSQLLSILSPWPQEKPENWKSLLLRPSSPHLATEIATALRSGKPFVPSPISVS